MNIIILNKVGFCYGVSNALKIVNSLSNTKNTYLLGDLVHNNLVSKDLEDKGIIVLRNKTRLEMVQNIPDNSTIIISAHGIGDNVLQKIKEKNLKIIDATCPFVKKSFDLVKDSVKQGYDIIFIGKENHPESEACLSISNKVHLFKSQSYYQIKNNKIKIAYQTTMSKTDILNDLLEINKLYPQAELLNMICHETDIRQNELIEICKKTYSKKPLIIVIGDHLSNNSTKLYETTKLYQNTIDSIFINSIEEINIQSINNYETIYLTSGTSTPNDLLDNIYKYINTITK